MEYNISMNNHKITNLGLPTSDKDAVNTGYVKTNFLNENGDLMSGVISVGRFRIIDMGLPINNNDVVNNNIFAI